MKRTVKSILATMLVAATLTTTAPLAIPAAAATTTSTATTAAATTKTTTMYVVKSCYSYKTASTKSAKVKTLYKGAAIKVTATKGSFYVLSDGSYVKKTNVGTKRINWTDTKYTTAITRYTAKDNTKVRSGALSTSKVVKTLTKGTKLTIVAKTNSGYYKLSDGNYVLATSVTKTKPTTTVTTNTAFPEDPYGPGENGYPELVSFYTGSGDGYGYVFRDGDLEGFLPDTKQKYSTFFNKKLTAIGGKDIPYGWYCIVGRDDDPQHARIYFPYEKAPTLDIYDVNGKHKTYGIYQHGELFYLGKGEKLVARNVVIAPAKNATITYRGVPSESSSDKLRNTDLQQSSLVTAKGTGYGIEAGTYKVTVDPDTDRFSKTGKGAWIYVVHDYANIQTVDVHQNLNNSIANTRDLATTGEFLYSDRSLAPNCIFEAEFRYRFDKNGKQLDGSFGNVQPEKDLTPKTITLQAGDLLICRGCTVSKVG